MAQIPEYYKDYGKGHGFATFISRLVGFIFGFIEILGAGFFLIGEWVLGFVFFFGGILLIIIKVKVEGIKE